MLNDNNFKNELRDKGYTIILVGDDVCANCNVMWPIINKVVSERRDDIDLYNIHLDQDTKELKEHYQIEAVPTTLLLYNGEEISKVKGYQPEEILSIYIDAKIEEDKKRRNC